MRTRIITIIANLISFGIQMFISLFITPIILEKIGTEAYGFIGLANDFIVYLSLITTIINSVSARFITLSWCEKKKEKAEKYFNSVIVMNIILIMLFIIIGCIYIPNITFFSNVPSNIVSDVKYTFLFTLISYIVNVYFSIYTTAPFVKDRLDIQGYRNILQYSLRGLFIVAIFTIFEPKIYLYSIAMLSVSVIIAFFDYEIYKKILPEIKIDLKKFSFGAVKELISSGGMLAISNLSSVLLSGLDLLIANISLGAYMMGILSAAKTMPTNISNAIIIIGSIFTPSFIALYSQNNINRLVKEIDNSIRLLTLVMYVPLVGFIIFSPDFYFLWLGSKTVDEIKLIILLSNIIVFECFFNLTTFPLAQLSLVTNKLKLPVIVSFILGVTNTITVIVLINFTNLGVYAIASVSTILLIVRYVLFNPWYAAKMLGVNKSTFFVMTFKRYIMLPVIFVFMYLVKRLIAIESVTWGKFIINILICGVISYIFMGLLSIITNRLKN